MGKPIYHYPTAFSAWDECEYAAIQRVVASGKFTMGDEVAAFEREFAAFHEMKHCVMVNSGSSANLIMIAALTHYGDTRGEHLRRGDPAYVPAVAWSTTYAPLIQHGLDIKLIDADDSWNARPYGQFADLKPGVIVGCSILGNPAQMELWRKLAEAHGCYYVEDNCESFGAFSEQGNRCGTLGLMNSFSFFYSHQISAVEGGAVLTNDDECADILRSLRAHGWTRDVPSWQQIPPSFETEYDFQLPGYNVRPTEIYAAVAREQLNKQFKHHLVRKRNLEFFRQEVRKREIPIHLPRYSGEQSSFSLHFEVPMFAGLRGRVVNALREKGVDCRMPTGGSMRRHVYGRPYLDQSTPRADIIHDCGMFLGNGPIDLAEKIDLALNVIKEAIG